MSGLLFVPNYNTRDWFGLKARWVVGQGSQTLSWQMYTVGGSRGDLAQLGERFHGMEEVRGSNPLISTTLLSLDRGRL